MTEVSIESLRQGIKLAADICEDHQRLKTIFAAMMTGFPTYIPAEQKEASVLKVPAAKEKSNGSGGYLYIKGLAKQIANSLNNDKYSAVGSGMTAQELTDYFMQIGSVSQSQGRRSVERVLGPMTGRGRKLTLQGNGRYILTTRLNAALRDEK